MGHLFVETKGELAVGSVFNLSGEHFKHYIKVLRHKLGSILRLISLDTSFYYDVKITKINRSDFDVISVNKFKKPVSAVDDMCIVQALVKGSKVDYIIQKATECGASRLIFFEADHSVKKISGKENKLLDRWRQIAMDAASQSEGFFVPQIDYCRNLDVVLDEMVDFSQNLCALERSLSPLFNVLDTNDPERGISVLIGPEGGFSAREKCLIEAADVKCFSLGTRILRTETTSVALLAIINFWRESKGL
jgi:16S rRNA (uracil1498-N3)-methyltransferase